MIDLILDEMSQVQSAFMSILNLLHWLNGTIPLLSVEFMQIYAILCMRKIFLYCDTESFNSKEIIYADGVRHLTIIRLIYM